MMRGLRYHPGRVLGKGRKRVLVRISKSCTVLPREMGNGNGGQPDPQPGPSTDPAPELEPAKNAITWPLRAQILETGIAAESS